MAIIDFFKRKEPIIKPSFRLGSSGISKSSFIVEQFKGEVKKNEFQFNKNLGEQHPFDYALVEGLYKKFPFITGVVNKYVDFIIGRGLYIKTKNKKAKKIIEDFIEETGFILIIAKWVKEALIKGTSYLELGGSIKKGIEGIKVLDSKWIFIKRDSKGNIQGFNQIRFNKRIGGDYGSLILKDFIPFDVDQIAMLTFDGIGDDPYGLGIVYPQMDIIDKYLKGLDDLHMLLKRKAGAPYDITVGDLATNMIPTQSDLDTVANDLQFQNNKTEWVHGPEMKIGVIDFGNITQKFTEILRTDEDLLFFGTQVPEVLMGRGNLAEGLAQVQLEAFRGGNIRSKQEEIEKIIEEKIFKRILNAQGIDESVEIEWGQPSEEDKNKRINTLNIIIQNPMISFGMKKEAEKELAIIMDFDEKKIQEENEKAMNIPIGSKEREDEQKEKLPFVPGQETGEEFKFLKLREIYNGFKEEKLDISENCTVQEWLGFNYSQFTLAILATIQKENFTFLLAENEIEKQAGYLSSSQINSLKKTLASAFGKNQNIIQLSQNINNNVKPGQLFKMKDGKIELNQFGQPILAMNADQRAMAIARTETTRMAANGLQEYYKENNIEQVRFLATISARTCPICENLDGQIYDINEIKDIVPVHSLCRCSWAALT